MNIINALKKYNVKSGELKRLSSKLHEINLKLDNYDKIKAASMNAVPYKWDEDGQIKDAEVMPRGKSGEHSSIVEDSVCSREELEDDKLMYEIKVAELNSFLMEVDSRLDCLKAEYKYILEKTYKYNFRIHHFIKEYNERFGIAEYETIKNYKSYAIKELLKL